MTEMIRGLSAMQLSLQGTLLEICRMQSRSDEIGKENQMML